jgi:hypothetical protein
MAKKKRKKKRKKKKIESNEIELKGNEEKSDSEIGIKTHGTYERTYKLTKIERYMFIVILTAAIMLLLLYLFGLIFFLIT